MQTIVEAILPKNGATVVKQPRRSLQGEREDRYGIIGADGTLKRVLFVDRKNGKVYEEMQDDDDDSAYEGRFSNSIKLGLVRYFYPVLHFMFVTHDMIRRYDSKNRSAAFPVSPFPQHLHFVSGRLHLLLRPGRKVGTVQLPMLRILLPCDTGGSGWDARFAGRVQARAARAPHFDLPRRRILCLGQVHGGTLDTRRDEHPVLRMNVE